MIHFPKDLTPIPNCPGYFWDVVDHKLYSIKLGGELRELKVHRLHPMAHHNGFSSRFSKIKVGEKYYTMSNRGIRRNASVRYLKTLTMVDYTIPQVKRKETVTV